MLFTTIRRILVAASAFVIVHDRVSAQSSAPNGNPEQRLSDLLRRTTSAEFFSASRYAPVMRFRGVGSWSSPRNSLLLDGVPFDAFPLGLRSPDHLPVDFLLVDSPAVVSHPHLTPLGRMEGGSVDIVRSRLPDSLTIRTRLYAGSETGDPVLRKYTRDNLPLYNKNKIGISGAASVANRDDQIAYRITGGLFGSFVTGYAERDPIMLSYIDQRMYSRQNRNYLGTVELEYGEEGAQKASLFAGINYFVGWEQMPFLSTFAFFEGHTNTIRIRLPDFLQDLELFGRRDESFVTMRRQLGTDAGEYSNARYVLSPVWKKMLSGSFFVSLYGEFALSTLAGSGGSQQFFDRDLDETGWAIGSAFDYKFEQGEFTGNLRVDRLHTQTTEVSGEAGVSLQPYTGITFIANAATMVSEPDLLELYGTFSASRFRPSPAQTDTFRISGNPLLVPGRVHSFDITGRSEAGISASFFYEIFERPIERRVDSIIRSAFPGDIIFSGSYINDTRRKLWGLEASCAHALSGGLDLRAAYAFTQNGDLPTVPKHRVQIRVTATILSSTTMDFFVHGQTKTVWKEFAVPPANDDKNGTGLDGVAPEFWSVDVSLTQRLGAIWFGREVRGRLEVQNLFQRHVQYIPIGISHDTAVIGYLSFML